MNNIMLVCRTNDIRDEGLDHMLVGLSPDFAQFLLTLKDGLIAAQNTIGSELHCLELFHGAGEWGRVDGYTSTGDWEQAPDETTIDEESIELQTIKATSTGVLFSACLKNDDSHVYAETPEIGWDALKRVADWDTGPAPKLFDGANIDMTVNCPDDEVEDDDDGDEPEGDDEEEEGTG